MSDKTISRASTASELNTAMRREVKEARRYRGPHEAAARKLRKAVKKSSSGKPVLGLADAAVNFGRELDQWDNDVPGRAAQLQEFGRTLREVAKYVSGGSVPDNRKFERMRALVKDVPDVSVNDNADTSDVGGT